VNFYRKFCTASRKKIRICVHPNWIFDNWQPYTYTDPQYVLNVVTEYINKFKSYIDSEDCPTIITMLQRAIDKKSSDLLNSYPKELKPKIKRMFKSFSEYLLSLDARDNIHVIVEERAGDMCVHDSFFEMISEVIKDGYVFEFSGGYRNSCLESTIRRMELEWRDSLDFKNEEKEELVFSPKNYQDLYSCNSNWYKFSKSDRRGIE